MDISKIGIGEDPPRDVNVLIEIPQGGVPVKYELDKESGALRVDRFLNTAMFYPGQLRLHPAHAVGRRRPGGRHRRRAEPGGGGRDRARASRGRAADEGRGGRRRESHRRAGRQAAPVLRGRKSYKDLPATLTDQIAHFFQHYKDLEKGKWVTIVNWVGTDRAEKMIVEGIRRAAGAGDDVAAHHVASGALKQRRK